MSCHPGGNWHPGWGVDLIILVKLAKATDFHDRWDPPNGGEFCKGNGTPAISGKSERLVKYYEPFGQMFGKKNVGI